MAIPYPRPAPAIGVPEVYYLFDPRCGQTARVGGGRATSRRFRDSGSDQTVRECLRGTRASAVLGAYLPDLFRMVTKASHPINAARLPSPNSRANRGYQQLVRCLYRQLSRGTPKRSRTAT
jgi:hypothetical protein